MVTDFRNSAQDESFERGLGLAPPDSILDSQSPLPGLLRHSEKFD